MTLEEKVAQLQGIWNRKREIQNARRRLRSRERAGAARIRHRRGVAPERDCRRRQRASLRALGARAGRVRQRRAEVADREHAARHPGDVPRGGAARARRARRHALPRADRAGEHLGSGARRAGHERGRARRRARAARSTCSRRSSISDAIRAGAASRRPTARIRISSRRWASPPCAATRARALPLAADKVFATLKHFAGHGSHEGGINTAPPLVPERLLRAELLVPFEAAIKARRLHRDAELQRGGRRAVARQPMAAHRRRCGGSGDSPASSSPTTSASSSSQTRHRVARDKADARRAGARGGRRSSSCPIRTAFPSSSALVKSGRVAEVARSTARSARMLRAKFLAGLFEQPVRRPRSRPSASTNTAEHQALALEAARKSIVLLKNQGGLLPLDRAQGEDAGRHRPQRQRACTSAATRAIPGAASTCWPASPRGPAPASGSLYARGRPHHRARGELGRATPWCSAIPSKNRARIQEAVDRATGRRDRAGHRHERVDRRAKRGPTTIWAMSPTSG